MLDNKNFDPTDDLFKKTFENLSNTPSANGWDAPSDRVWQNIQQNITAAPASSGSNLMRILLVAAAVSMVAAGVYFFTKKEKQPAPDVPEKPKAEQPVATQPAENQEVATPTAVSNPASNEKIGTEKAVGKPDSKPVLPTKNPSSATTTEPVNSTQKNQPDVEKPQQYDYKNDPAKEKPNVPALPMPDKKQDRPKPPARNHSELNKQESGN